MRWVDLFLSLSFLLTLEHVFKLIVKSQLIHISVIKVTLDSALLILLTNGFQKRDVLEKRDSASIMKKMEKILTLITEEPSIFPPVYEMNIIQNLFTDLCRFY